MRGTWSNRRKKPGSTWSHLEENPSTNPGHNVLVCVSDKWSYTLIWKRQQTARRTLTVSLTPHYFWCANSIQQKCKKKLAWKSWLWQLEIFCQYLFVSLFYLFFFFAKFVEVQFYMSCKNVTLIILQCTEYFNWVLEFRSKILNKFKNHKWLHFSSIDLCSCENQEIEAINISQYLHAFNPFLHPFAPNNRPHSPMATICDVT